MPPSKGQPDLRENLFGGRGVVRVWNLLADHRAPPSPFTAVLSCELDPGGSVGRHVQEQFPEIVIGLEGSGAAAVDGRVHSLDPGDVVHLPLGSVLELRNCSDREPLRYLIIKARGASAGGG
ncbi:MAG TPA: cupin domain-containing protein [Enhygromyxa sp.]|nr:cupin domain-containing protein [Enhygromyxa sp.]